MNHCLAIAWSVVLLNARMIDATFTFDVQSDGEPYVIQRSSDLVNWETKTALINHPFVHVFDNNPPGRFFYRANTNQ